MSIIPGEKLHYAETHFKFKLPWSLLYRPWPEILMDAPFQFVPGTEPTLWLVIRDAHRFPTLVEKIEVSASCCENNDINVSKVIDLDIQATKQFEFHPVKISDSCRRTTESTRLCRWRNALPLALLGRSR